MDCKRSSFTHSTYDGISHVRLVITCDNIVHNMYTIIMMNAHDRPKTIFVKCMEIFKNKVNVLTNSHTNK